MAEIIPIQAPPPKGDTACPPMRYYIHTPDGRQFTYVGYRYLRDIETGDLLVQDADGFTIAHFSKGQWTAIHMHNITKREARANLCGQVI